MKWSLDCDATISPYIDDVLTAEAAPADPGVSALAVRILFEGVAAASLGLIALEVLRLKTMVTDLAMDC